MPHPAQRTRPRQRRIFAFADGFVCVAEPPLLNIHAVGMESDHGRAILTVHAAGSLTVACRICCQGWAMRHSTSTVSALDFEGLVSREWLVTNGLGGYA